MNPVETRTIQLDCNGGTVNGKDKVAYTVKNGSSYGQLPVPVRSGYQFVAWKDEKGNTIYSGSTVEPDTEKLSCVWSKTLKFWANSYINGQPNEYFKNCGYATLYINGKLYTKDQDFLYTDKLKTGDTFKIDNISAQKGYVYTGFRNGVGTEFQYEYYENGLVKSISGQVKEDNIGIYCDFESDNVLQNIIRQYNIKEIDVDSTPPTTSVSSIGSTNLFASKDDCYVIDNTLHIYNPEGGKVVAPVDSTNLFSNLTIVKLNLQGLDTAQVKYATGMFRNNYYMMDLNVSSFVTSRFESMESMFEKCNGLTNLDVSKFDTSNVTNMFRLFFVGGAGTKYDPTFIDSTGARIDGGPSNPGYFTAISDKPLETPQTNSETTGNEVRSVETPVKEPDEWNQTQNKTNQNLSNEVLFLYLLDSFLQQSRNCTL